MSTTPAQNTKIERVVEGVESLANAVAAHQRAPSGKGSKSFNVVLEARKELHAALSQFLQPALRVIEGGNRKAS